jgi:hypothetical protein
MLLISLPFNKVVRLLGFLFKHTIKCSNLTNDYHYPVHVSFCAGKNLLFFNGSKFFASAVTVRFTSSYFIGLKG